MDLSALRDTIKQGDKVATEFFFRKPKEFKDGEEEDEPKNNDKDNFEELREESQLLDEERLRRIFDRVNS